MLLTLVKVLNANIFTKGIFLEAVLIKGQEFGHLELVVNSNIFLWVFKVSQDDLQLVRILVGQTVEGVKANPALSSKVIVSF